ncbi:hypothetical protein [Pseudanabaena sp. 'Roaring Creek']|uniref:hypothetical protein n=1 Tax=Pseudanabaena sp. 'Roaring Creek' TaxID=1681830 RepID=UPI0006D7A6A8|nr:hypothetical protein [Pseudanabaena sp. 'Roaring Creek']
MPFVPDSSTQSVSSVAYIKQSIVSTSTELDIVAGYNSNYIGSSKRSEIDYNLSLDPTAIAKKSTFTLSLGSVTAGDTVEIDFTDGSASPKLKKYVYTIQAGDTEAEIALGLAAFAATNPFIAVSANVTTSPALITVKSAIPGQDYNLAVSKTGTSVTLSAITTVNAAVGSPAIGKIFSITVDITVSTDGYIQFQPTFNSFDGSASPALLSSIPLAPTKHQQSLQALQAAHGF